MLALLFNGLPQEALQHAQHVLKEENLLRESNDTKAMTRFYASAALRMAGRPPTGTSESREGHAGTGSGARRGRTTCRRGRTPD